MSKPRLYLAGPILGLTEGDAKDWRDDFTKRLQPSGIVCVSPLRCEPSVDGVYASSYGDLCFGTAGAITAKNYMDVQSCAAVLCYFPYRGVGKDRSAGTIAELAWSFALQKPRVVVSDDDFIRNHPVIKTMAQWMLPDLEAAERLFKGILPVYCDRTWQDRPTDT